MKSVAVNLPVVQLDQTNGLRRWEEMPPRLTHVLCEPTGERRGSDLPAALDLRRATVSSSEYPRL
jgi:hypothetical protein